MSKGTSKNGSKIQKNLLRKLAKDERLHPNKRFLATLLLGYIDDMYPIEVVTGTYSGAKRVNWDDKTAPINSPETQTKVDLDARQQLKTIFAEVLGGDDDADTSSD